MTDAVTNDSVLQLTAAAAEQVRSMLAKSQDAGKHLRVYVEQGGCSGMQYGLVFDQQRDGDLISEQEGLVLLVDPFSAKYVRGAVVDFSDALTGGGFKISNPNAKQSCGCGKSFET